MDDSGAFHSGHSGEKNRDALPSSDEFVSFMDDLNKRTDFTEVPGDSGFADNGGDLFAGVEPLPCHESHSVFSPTTVASEELHDKHGPEHFGVVIPANSSGSRGEPTVNFDNALNVAFNSTVQEQPKQIWETGIWKYIFGNDDSELDFDVWGRPLKRPIPAVWGVDQSSLDKEPTGVLKRSRFQSCNFMDVVSFKPGVPWRDQREADLQRGIKLWIAVTSRWDDGCTLVCRLGEMRNEAEVFDMFAHVFSGRAPVTVRKRGMAILKLCDYLEENNLERFPMKELTCYRFMCLQQSEGAPASRLQGMIQALTFCRHVLDVVELQEVLDSKRCQGVSREKHFRKSVSRLVH